MTHKGLPAYLLDERVDDLAEDLEGDLRSADLGRVAVHARLPESALGGHGWYPPFSAQIRPVRKGALSNVLYNVHGVLPDAMFYVALDYQNELHQEVYRYGS